MNILRRRRGHISQKKPSVLLKLQFITHLTIIIKKPEKNHAVQGKD